MTREVRGGDGRSVVALDDLADRLDEVGAAVCGAGAALDRLDPGTVAFGGDAPGRLGDLGRALHDGWVTAAVTRGREAVAQGTRLTEAAHAVRLAAAAYREADREAAGTIGNAGA